MPNQNAKPDSNNRLTLIGTLNSDGLSTVTAYADPTLHYLLISDGTSGSDNGNNSGTANLDDNGTAVCCAESSDGSGTIIEIYFDSSNHLLTKST